MEAMTAPMPRFDALTFDCYGTLIDWRHGLLRSVRNCASLRGHGFDEERFLADREAAELRIESVSYLPYREVVAASVREGLAAQGRTISIEEAAAVGASVGEWEPFPDTPAALAMLRRGWRLAILSNVERRDLERSVARLGVAFDALVTADEVRSYKPATAHFETGLRRLVLPRERVLHIAQSVRHDLGPAAALGIASVWVNRLGEPEPEGVPHLFTAPDLATVAARLASVGG